MARMQLQLPVHGWSCYDATGHATSLTSPNNIKIGAGNAECPRSIFQRQGGWVRWPRGSNAPFLFRGVVVSEGRLTELHTGARERRCENSVISRQPGKFSPSRIRGKIKIPALLIVDIKSAPEDFQCFSSRRRSCAEYRLILFSPDTFLANCFTLPTCPRT